MSKQYFIKNLAQLKNLAIEIASTLKPPCSLLLYGDLGAGKTTLAQFIIKHLTNDEELEVTSPTFNLVHNYQTLDNISIWHFDLYRLKHRDEIYELAFEDAIEGIAIFEWPELIIDIIPKPYISIHITFGENEGERVIKIT